MVYIPLYTLDLLYFSLLFVVRIDNPATCSVAIQEVFLWKEFLWLEVVEC
jgi:hypothetical protein